MCSSPKSSGHASPKNTTIRGIFAELTREKQAQFTAIANAADERRQRQLQGLSASRNQSAKSSYAKQRRDASPPKHGAFSTMITMFKRAYQWSSQQDLYTLLR